MPLGLDGFWWRVMGHGIDWMISVAQWVTSFPGALGRVTAFGTGPLRLWSAGLVVLCLLKTPLRFTGALLIGVAAVLMLRSIKIHVIKGHAPSEFHAARRAFSYIRMSSDVQLKGDSLRRQLAKSREYAEKHGLALVETDELKDLGVSAFRGRNIREGALGASFWNLSGTGKCQGARFSLSSCWTALDKEKPRARPCRFSSISSMPELTSLP